jgi:hypothetical protein
MSARPPTETAKSSVAVIPEDTSPRAHRLDALRPSVDQCYPGPGLRKVAADGTACAARADNRYSMAHQKFVIV